MRRATGLVFCWVLGWLSACAVPAPAPPLAPTLTVFAAASLTDAFLEIGKAFDAANPGVTTTFNFAGSQALRTQIEEGAPVDVFASASSKEMDSLMAGSFVAADVAQVFLSNRLVVILPADNPAALETRRLCLPRLSRLA